MQRISDYRGPGADDYANVLAFNTAFLVVTTELRAAELRRLAAAPFLLFSMRENDLEWWDDALVDRHQADLMGPHEQPNTDLRRLQTAAISFLWHLSRRNPYAVRIISGAPVAWCDRITALPLVTLLNRLGARADLLRSRIDVDEDSGGRLLGHGTSSKALLRRSAQLAVLQGLLTRPGLGEYTRLKTAACGLSRPMRVLEKKV
jgi:hypothetical protein